MSLVKIKQLTSLRLATLVVAGLFVSIGSDAWAAVEKEVIEEEIPSDKVKTRGDRREDDLELYTIKEGEFLGSIAIAHETTIAKIVALNEIENPNRVFAGMKIKLPTVKKDIVITVPKGFNLWKIAKTYEVPIQKIVHANKSLRNPDSLRAGQKLLIPGVTEERELIPPPPCFNDAVEFYRVRNDKTEMISLTFCNGKANPAAIEQLSEFAAPVHLDEVPFPLHARLMVLLQKVANKYPGKRLEIISAQRINKSSTRESYHNKGQAIDFRVEGVSNLKLSRFVRSFKHVGVGYYPNSVFIHMDTRKDDAYWVDYSRPGEKPIYAKRNLSDKALAEIRAKRAAKKERKAQNDETASETEENQA